MHFVYPGNLNFINFHSCTTQIGGERFTSNTYTQHYQGIFCEYVGMFPELCGSCHCDGNNWLSSNATSLGLVCKDNKTLNSSLVSTIMDPIILFCNIVSAFDRKQCTDVQKAHQ